MNLTQITNNRIHSHELFSTHNDCRRLVLIFPTWAGITEFERNKARQLNAAGHDAVVVDLFGNTANLSSLEGRQAAMAPFLADLSTLQQRIAELVDHLRKPLFEGRSHIAAIGFCLGGLCAVHSGLQEEEIHCAVSFHGLLKLPRSVGDSAANTRFMILNGSQDPMVCATEVADAIRFFDASSLDMMLVSLSGTVHSFMLPDAANPEAGVLYNAKSAARSWQLCEDFLCEETSEKP